MTYPRLRITIAERTVSHVATDKDGVLLDHGVEIVSSCDPVMFVGDLINLVQEMHGDKHGLLWVGIGVEEAEE